MFKKYFPRKVKCNNIYHVIFSAQNKVSPTVLSSQKTFSIKNYFD